MDLDKFESEKRQQLAASIKRTHIELGVSLALIWMRDWQTKTNLDTFKLEELDALFSNDNIEAIMATARLGDGG